MSIKVWVAENRGKNGKGHDLVVYNNRNGVTLCKPITKADLRTLLEAKVKILEG
mgnify:CR=1 FL=1